jgi:ribosomal protein S15P/S13E
MNWHLDINTLLQILSLVAMAVTGWNKLQVVERDLQRVEKEVVDSREIRSQLAVMQAQLTLMATSVERLTNHFNEYIKDNRK